MHFIMELTSQDEDLLNESNNNFNSDELTTPGVVVEQLKNIAESGIVEIDWIDLQRALKLRIENVLEHYMERNRDSKDEQYQEPNVEKFNLESSRDEILELIASFNEAPFTIQRICELLHSPFKYYDRVSTFLRGLEKNLRVISSNNWPKSQITTESEEVESPAEQHHKLQPPTSEPRNVDDDHPIEDDPQVEDDHPIEDDLPIEDDRPIEDDHHSGDDNKVGDNHKIEADHEIEADHKIEDENAHQPSSSE